MRADLGAIYDERLTIVNRLDAKDAGAGQDAYVATVLDGCMWTQRIHRSVQSDGTVAVGSTTSAQVPEAASYVPYREWAKLPDRTGTFTVRHGDYVFRGEVGDVADATALKALAASWEPDAFQVQHFRALVKGAGFEHPTSGVLRFAEVLYLEG